MAVVSGSTGQNNPTGDDKQAEAEEAGSGCVFDMISLRDHLPQKRKGLSAYFSGKSRSFMCVADAKCIDDLKKEEVPEAKRRKYTEGQAQVLSVFSRRAPLELFSPLRRRRHGVAAAGLCRRTDLDIP